MRGDDGRAGMAGARRGRGPPPHNAPTIASATSRWIALRASIGALELGVVDRRENRGAAGRAEDRDGVGGSVVAAAGLVGDAPGGRQAGAQALVADLVAGHPGFELAARACRQGVAEQQRLQVARHRRRRGGVALVAGNGGVEAGLVAIDPREFVAERTRIARHAGGAAERPQHEIGGGVVAPLDRRGAEVGEAHRAVADMRFGQRRVFEEIARPVGDAPVEPLRPRVHALENGGGGEDLERAAQRETLVGAMRQTSAALRVEHGDAETPAGARLDRRDALARRLQGVARAGADGREACRQADDEGAAAALQSHCESPRSAPRRPRVIVACGR